MRNTSEKYKMCFLKRFAHTSQSEYDTIHSPIGSMTYRASFIVILTASGIRVSQWIKAFFTNWTTIIRRGRDLSPHAVEEKIKSDFSWWCRSRSSSRAYDPSPLVLSFGFNADYSVISDETLEAKVTSGNVIIDTSIIPTVLKLLLGTYFHRLWSWRVALIHEHVELFPGVNVSLCSDCSFATRIVVIRAIVATSENSVASYSMQSRADRTWCMRSKNSTDVSAIRVCRNELSQVSTEMHSCNHEFGHGVSSPSRLEARTWQNCLSLDWVSRDTEINVSWHHPVVRGWSSARTRGSCQYSRSRAEIEHLGTVTTCFIDALMTGDPKAHGLRNESDDRVRYVKRRHLEVKCLWLQQLNYAEVPQNLRSCHVKKRSSESTEMQSGPITWTLLS